MSSAILGWYSRPGHRRENPYRTGGVPVSTCLVRLELRAEAPGVS